MVEVGRYTKSQGMFTDGRPIDDTRIDRGRQDQGGKEEQGDASSRGGGGGCRVESRQDDRLRRGVGWRVTERARGKEQENKERMECGKSRVDSVDLDGFDNCVIS